MTGRLEPCESCRVNCCAVQRPAQPQACLAKNCSFCADVAAIDDEILSAACEHISSFVEKRMQIIEKRHEEAFIQRLPFEILSMIFLLFKDEYVVEATNRRWASCMSWFKVPTQVPHLLVSSVCKGWREIALNIPMLWKDIVVDLMKSAESQLWVVDEWARRSSPLPFNLTICMSRMDNLNEEEALEDFTNVITQLRRHAIRWNDLTLRVPWSFCHKVLDGLEESLSIRSMYYLHDNRFQFAGEDPVKLHHPLRPRHFFCHFLSPLASAIFFEWSRLVHLNFSVVQIADLLNVISNAPNLTRCESWSIYPSSIQDLSYFPRYITSRSLKYLYADYNVMDRLTLPSLHTLGYSCADAREVDIFVEFISRSLPPLQSLRLCCNSSRNLTYPPSFEKLSGIVRLSISLYYQNPYIEDFLQTLVNCSSDNANVVLPALQELNLYVCSMPGASWSHVSRLFRRNPKPNTPGVDRTTAFSGRFKRPLAKITIAVENENPFFDLQRVPKTYLRLLAIKNSGVELRLEDDNGVSLLDRIAK